MTRQMLHPVLTKTPSVGSGCPTPPHRDGAPQERRRVWEMSGAARTSLPVSRVSAGRVPPPGGKRGSRGARAAAAAAGSGRAKPPRKHLRGSLRHLHGMRGMAGLVGLVGVAELVILVRLKGLVELAGLGRMIAVVVSATALFRYRSRGNSLASGCATKLALWSAAATAAAVASMHATETAQQGCVPPPGARAPTERARPHRARAPPPSARAPTGVLETATPHH
ncbi:unnamed protein product [Lampetra planeri]